MAELTAERLRELVHYDTASGVFTRLKVATKFGTTSAHRRYTGRKLGTVDKRNNTVQIGIDGRVYFAHRLAWLYVHGKWPENEIDHINGDQTDNRLCNLRDVTRSVNMQNRRKPMPGTKSGYLGVEWSGTSWRARIKKNKVRYELGCYPTPEEAFEAYLKAKRRLHEGCTI
jgi:hypothetical protein